MNIRFGITMDAKCENKTDLIINLSNEMKAFFENRDYGNDIKNYTIGFKSVNIPKGYEHLFKQHKPSYVKDKTTINKFTGENHRMYKLFLDDITLTPEEYNVFISSSDYDSLELVKRKIIDSLSNLDKLPKSVRDFDKERFKKDMNIVLGYSA